MRIGQMIAGQDCGRCEFICSIKTRLYRDSFAANAPLATEVIVVGLEFILEIFSCNSVAIQLSFLTSHFSLLTSHFLRHHHYVPALQDDVLLQILSFLDIAIAERD
jgi:hypothetical protein